MVGWPRAGPVSGSGRLRCDTFAADGPRIAVVNQTRLDLFDGHRSDGSYDSIGIGDKQPKEYAVLTVKDRMSLAVLQVRHSISIQTNTTHLPAPVRTLTCADG